MHRVYDASRTAATVRILSVGFRFARFIRVSPPSPVGATRVSLARERGEPLAAGGNFRAKRHTQTHRSRAAQPGKWNAEAALLLRGSVVCSIVLLAVGCDSSPQPQVPEASVPAIIKQPVVFANHTFDPASPPPDMPPLAPGEAAECDSNFLSGASVRGQSRRTDATHATLTITQITVTLRLNISIWVPNGASPQLIEHEEGHRQISEHYYETADKLAERIAATYMGRRVEIPGTDVGIEANKALQDMAAEITAEYNKELNPGPAQLLYDSITDHGRSDVIVKDAVAHALNNAMIEATGANTATQ
jgi:hypothetical protein